MEITKKQLSKIIEGINEKRIIELLVNQKTLNVGEIVTKLKMNQGTVSTILGEFKKIKLVHCQVDGKYRHYSIDKKFYDKIKDTYKQIEKEEKDKIKNLFKDVEVKQRDPFIFKQKSPVLK